MPAGFQRSEWLETFGPKHQNHMKRSTTAALLLTSSLLVGGVGCKSMTADKARTRSEQMQRHMTIDEVYQLLGKPKETFAEKYVWEYYWPGQGTGRLLHIEFVEEGGKWVVYDWEWR